MTTIDYSTPEGKLRMRLGDISDLPFLPSSVYTAVYAENDNSIVRATKALGSMILAQLSYKTHRKMGLQLEVWGKEAFDSYKEFLMLTLTNPAFMDISPLPLESLTKDNRNVLQEFISDWNRNYYNGTQSQEMALDADISPNDGSREGPLGALSTNAQDFNNNNSGWIPV